MKAKGFNSTIHKYRMVSEGRSCHWFPFTAYGTFFSGTVELVPVKSWNREVGGFVNSAVRNIPNENCAQHQLCHTPSAVLFFFLFI